VNELTLKVKPTAYGPMCFLPNDVYVGGSLDAYGEFSAGEQDFFHFVARGGAAVDVGANMGAHSVPMAKWFSHLYAFEPQEIIYRILRFNLANSLNATSYKAAVGNEEGVVYFPALDYSVKNNYGAMHKDLGKDQDIQMIPVQVRMLDKVDALRAEENIDLIKVDVEGMEKDVLEGAQYLIDKYRPVLYVENDKPDKMKALVQFINNLGYKAYWHITPLFRPDNFYQNQENIFGPNNIVSFNLICLPEKHWLTLNNAVECTPENIGLPEGYKI